MKIFKKERLPNGRTHVYLKLFSYNDKFQYVYGKRFSGLTQKELEFCVKSQYKMWHGKKLNLKSVNDDMCRQSSCT